MDEPEFILAHWMNLHHNMVKQLRGVPGVTPERFEE